MSLALAAAVLLAAAAVLVGYQLKRSEPAAMAVDECVALRTGAPVEYGCADSQALYRIVAREAVVWPLESACMKYSDATKAVAEPVATGAQPEIALCLAPTRFNSDDPGALQADDCVTVKGAGETVTRVPCGSSGLLSRVVSTELHRQVPVTDRACREQPKARQAFAHSSLGGRAIVVCAVATDPKDIDNAVVGDCTGKDMTALMRCDQPGAYLRILTVGVVHQKPSRPECRGVTGANSSSMAHNDKTDLVLVVCLGPVPPNDSAYAQVGDCVAVDKSGGPVQTQVLDCAQPAATYRVIERHESDDGVCPDQGSARITLDSGVTNGSTICLSRK
ncbi:hypothetical protein FB390_5361 [Nocardia bhagyanarayanae]|uniref:Uncharacterized protein n=1 Tax=Nocardia bhagyanarayanae TaxID=1215925 RepID=A0A543FIH9_9NOCA|nr:hypothetical protein FB390_5361 [Nocardia bhagyanarayanae]